jgi:DNA-binding transcriptional MerR regulator
MTGHGAKFGRKKEEAVAALLVHRSVEEAAKAIGVEAKTLRRWQKIPEFEAAYRQARRDAFEQTVGRLQQLSAAGVTTLGRLMLDANTPAAVKARCAYCLVTLATKAIETEDILPRLADLERAAEEAKKNGRK